MGQTERLYKIKSQLDAGRCLTRSALLAELETSPATDEATAARWMCQN